MLSKHTISKEKVGDPLASKAVTRVDHEVSRHATPQLPLALQVELEEERERKRE